jgi:steroid delta-isomerase-like uncharacterized protein
MLALTTLGIDELRRRREEIVNRHMEAESEGDIEGTIATFFKPRYEVNGTVFDGADAVRELLRTFIGAMTDLESEHSDKHHADNGIFMEARINGTHSGEFLGLPPTGRRIELASCGIFEFEEDRLVCEKVYFDTGTVLAQLGMVSGAGS